MAVFSERIALLIDAKTGGAVQPLDHLAKQAKETDTAFGKMSKSIGVSSSTLKTGLVAGATALVGTGLVEFINRTAGAYADAALAANQLSRATNASVENASRFMAVTSKFGLDINDLTEIAADFQQAVAQGSVDLDAFGVAQAKNADGTTDWIATMVTFIDTINRIPDATERNLLMNKAFGEEGAKQLGKLAAAGKTLEEQMKAVQTAQIFGTKDVQAALEYNEAMQELGASAKSLQLELGQNLAPIVSGLASMLVPVIEIIGKVPTEVYLVVGAFYALNTALTSNLAVGIARSIAGLLLMVSTMGFTTAATFTLAAAWESLTAVLIANPVGLVVAAIAVAVGLAVKAQGDFNDTVDDAVAKMAELEKQGLSTAEAISQLARESENTDSVLAGMAATVEGQSTFEKLATAVTGTVGWLRVFHDSVTEGGDSLKAYEDAIAKVREEQGEYGVKTAEATAKQAGLNEMLAKGGYNAEQLATAVKDAALAQENKQRIDEESARLVKAYADATWDAVDATLAMFDKEFAAADAKRGLKDAIDGVAEAQEAYNEAQKKAVGDGYTQAQKDREVAAAKRDIAAAHDDVAEAALRDASAQAELRTGATDTEAAYAVMLETLNKDLTLKGLSKEDKEKITDIITDIEAARDTAAGGIEIGGIKFKGGTEKEAKRLMGEIESAMRLGHPEIAAALQQDLDKLKIPPMPVTLTRSDGKPLDEDVSVAVNVDTSQIDTAKAAVAGLGEPKTHQIEFNTIVTNDDNTRNVLRGLADPKKYVIEYNTDVTNDDNTRNVLRGLADPDTYRIEYNTVVTNEQNTRNVLNGLDNDRDVYFRVHVTGASAARAQLASMQTASQMSALLSPMGVTPMAATPMAVNTSQTFSINVSGAGNPAVTAREIERYIRRAGDRSRVSVTG